MSDDEKKKALADASHTLPPATAFHTEISEDEDGGREYSVDTEGLLSALGPEFAESTLTKDQLQAFGFNSDEMLERLPKQIQDNLCLGIRLYYLLQTVYEANPELDASCCSVLFCKAIELQMKECFVGSFRKMFPDHMINGRMPFAKADIGKLTLGNFHNIINKNLNKLADRMKERGELQYDLQWWKRYAERIDQCAKKRNRCCHSGLFTWEDQKSLISEIFLKEEPEEKQGNGPVMRGTLFEAEVGRRLLKV